MEKQKTLLSLQGTNTEIVEEVENDSQSNSSVSSASLNVSDEDAVGDE